MCVALGRIYPARMRECTSRTYSCGVPAGMIEGRKGKKGEERAESRIFRPTNLRCLFSGLYNWIQNDGYPLYLALVGRHFNFRALHRFRDPHVSTCLFLFRDLRGLLNGLVIGSRSMVTLFGGRLFRLNSYFGHFLLV